MKTKHTTRSIEAQQMLDDIARIVEGEEVTFCKVTTPVNKKIEIDKYALQKLLMNKPQATPVENQKTTYLRCNREGEEDVWESYVEGQRTEFRAGILVNANLSAEEKDIRVGCGGSYHIGMAAGFMASTGQPVKVPASQVRRLWFDSGAGEFRDLATSLTLKGCDYLILKPKCHAEWIASPAQAKILAEMSEAYQQWKHAPNPKAARAASHRIDALTKQWNELSV